MAKDKPVVLLNDPPPAEEREEPKAEPVKTTLPQAKLGKRFVVASNHQNIVGMDPDGRTFEYRPGEVVVATSANQARVSSLYAGGLLTEA